MNPLTHLSLFSGIGGIDLATHWSGFQSVAFVEQNEFCQKVLAKNFPGVPIFSDVRAFDGFAFRGIDLLSGGFPCQDVAGVNKNNSGLNGDRSGLWFEMLRIIREARPRFVLAENVNALLRNGHDRVCSGLEEAGYTTETYLLAASDIGASHERDRVFIVAYADRQPGQKAYSPSGTLGGEWNTRNHAVRENRGEAPGTHWAVHQPRVLGVADGLPNRVDRTAALGNAVDPHQVYPICKAIALRLTQEQAL